MLHELNLKKGLTLGVVSVVRLARGLSRGLSRVELAVAETENGLGVRSGCFERIHILASRIGQEVEDELTLGSSLSSCW